MELLFWKIPPMAWFMYYNFPKCEYSFNLSDTHVKYLMALTHHGGYMEMKVIYSLP